MSVAFVDIGDPPSSIHDNNNDNGRGEDKEDNVEGGDDNDNDDSGSGSDFGSEWELEQVDKDNNKDKDKEEVGNHDDNTSNNMARGGVWKLCDEPRPLLCVLDVLSLSG